MENSKTRAMHSSKTQNKTRSKTLSRCTTCGQKNNDDMIKTAYDVYNEEKITVEGFTGMPSIAARHTAIEKGGIQFDAGNVPREVGMTKKCVLITHFHSDHGADLPNCYGFDEKVTIFVPAECAAELFQSVKDDMSRRKGRQYTDKEIVDIVRIIGCRRDNSKSEDQDATIMSNDDPALKIVEYVKMGEHVRVQLHGREEVMIEPFACYHTVVTCGYIVHEIRKRLSDTIIINKGAYVEANFTEDQPVKKDKKKERDTEGTEETIKETNIDVSNSKDDMYDWKKDPKYVDVLKFSEKHGVEIVPSIVDEVRNKGYVLKVRRLTFPSGMAIKTKNENNEYILSGDDFAFFKKYKIEVSVDHLIPQTMFFGDTHSRVFDPSTSGYNRVMEMMGKVKYVIIESTYLESRKEMGEKKYKERAEKRHMFLFELCPLFIKFPNTKFILIHFSACYNKKSTVRNYISRVEGYGVNVIPFL